MDSGIYHLQAVYVNTYGVTSAVAEETYTVDVRTLSAPFVSLEAGTYTEPQMIEVETPSDMYQVYYTTDGSEPGFESNLYTGPIPLPLGESHFAFIMYDERIIQVILYTKIIHCRWNWHFRRIRQSICSNRL